MSAITGFSKRTLDSDDREFIRLNFITSRKLEITIERYSNGWASIHWPSKSSINDWIEAVTEDNNIHFQDSVEVWVKKGDNIELAEISVEEVRNHIMRDNIIFVAVESSSGDYEVTWDRSQFSDSSLNEITILFKKSGLAEEIFIGNDKEKHQYPKFSRYILDNYLSLDLAKEKDETISSIESIFETPWKNLPKFSEGYDFDPSEGENSDYSSERDPHRDQGDNDDSSKYSKKRDRSEGPTPSRVQDQALSLLEDARDNGTVKKGTNETTKAVERGNAEFVLIAKNVSPEEIVMHLPELAEEKGIPYLMVETQDEICHAVGWEIESAAAAITELTTNPERLDEMGSTIEDISDDEEDDIWKKL
jgi:large subunit ribosomal protein L7Ae